MWMDAFKSILKQPDSYAGRLLARKVPLQGPTGALRTDISTLASSALAVQPISDNRPRHLVIKQPDASPSEARLILLSVAFASLAAHSGRDRSAVDVTGDLLFVTQQIVQCRALLQSILVKQISITDCYRIASVAEGRSSEPKTTVYLANPGRVKEVNSLPRFGAVVIDASHPRTRMHLSRLWACPPIAKCQLIIVLSPPVDDLLVDDGLTWHWDPQSIAQLEQTVSGKVARPDVPGAQRHYWIATDPEVEEQLRRAHTLLAGATRLIRIHPPQALLDAWDAYHRFRNLAIPLEQAERAWRQTPYKQTLGELIDKIRHSNLQLSGDARNYLELNWQPLQDALRSLYGLFAERLESAKFYAVAEAVTAHFEQEHRPLRIVAGNKEEAILLGESLADLVDPFEERLKLGEVEVVHPREEARRVADGHYADTVLAGSRASQQRYLDVYPPNSVHVVAYGYEAEADQAVLDAQYRRQHELASPKRRCKVLSMLGMRAQPDDGSPRPPVPRFQLHGSISQTQEKPIRVDPDPFTIRWEPAEGTGVFSHGSSGQNLSGLPQKLLESLVMVSDSESELHYYFEEQRVDVYYPETEVINRVTAKQLRQGDYLILLLDDKFEALWERLLQALSERRPLKETALLERWRLAKRRLLRSYKGNRQQIFGALGPNLSVGYPAVLTWFRDEEDAGDETMAPLSQEDFFRLARLTKIYKDEADMQETFDAINNERTNHRKLGRAMHAALVGLAKGDSYDAALRAAEALDTPVDDVLNAVDIREIISIERPQLQRAED